MDGAAPGASCSSSITASRIASAARRLLPTSPCAARRTTCTRASWPLGRECPCREWTRPGASWPRERKEDDFEDSDSDDAGSGSGPAGGRLGDGGGARGPPQVSRRRGRGDLLAEIGRAHV